MIERLSSTLGLGELEVEDVVWIQGNASFDSITGV